MRIFRFLFFRIKSIQQIEPVFELPPGDLIKVKVFKVIDGDTVDVISGEELVRIRLDAIDCPEGNQLWGNLATAGLVKLIGGKEVYLEPYGLDRYGRNLATIYVMQKHELINVNECMVKRGHAWVMRLFYEHLSKPRQMRLNKLESWAKKKRVGLWQLENPIPPWEYRKEDFKKASGE